MSYFDFASGPASDPASDPDPLPLCQVLIEEYEHQRSAPPLPPDFVAALIASHTPRLEREHALVEDRDERCRLVHGGLVEVAVDDLLQLLADQERARALGPPLPGGFVAGLVGEHRPRLERLHRAIRDPAERACRVESDLDEVVVAAFHRFLHQNCVRRSAICFSGGGIRSATFGLGVVQGLARKGLLGAFDYLSTVSGGGYLGSWLSAWIHRESGRRRHRGPALAAVERQLASPPRSPLEPEPEPVRYLRSYTRYMSPTLGILSADTWTLFGTFLRNLTLNWLVFLPLIAAILMFPRLSAAVVLKVAAEDPAARERIARRTLYLAIGLGALVIAFFAVCRPSLADAGRSRIPPWLRTQGWFLTLGLLPLWLLAVSTTAYWAWIDLHFYVLGYLVKPVVAFAIFGGVFLGFGGYLVSRLAVRGVAPLEALSLVFTAGLGGLLAWAAAVQLFPDPKAAIRSYVCFGAPLLLLLFLSAATIFVGVSSKFTDDTDREWWGRAGSWVLILIAARAGLSAIVIFGPEVLLSYGPRWLSALGGISGFVTLFLGSSARTAASKKPGAVLTKTDRAKRLALTLAAPVFAVFLLVVLSLGTSLLLLLIADTYFPALDFHLSSPMAYDAPGLTLAATNAILYAPWWLVLLVAALLLAVGGCMGLVVNINRFSLHAAYRDRLIRAYLGASRRERNPNPFTGFDAADNLQMCELAANRPLPLLNLTLNLVAGKKLAWQDRKAEPFSVTPLHCGGCRIGYRRAAEYAHTQATGQSLTLGTAMAISGAAASPNMGYHSSPAITFLMTLFNVRLGWWLGNPKRSTYKKAGPRFAPGPLFSEAFGLTDDEKRYIYLSDGGHFENLGLYEMVLRRCHLVVVSDAGEDADFKFEDLGGAIAKIRIDLGVPIEFRKILMRPRDPQRPYDLTHSGDQAPYAAVGRICYSCADRLAGGRPLAPEDDGWLIYLKASLNGSEPVDVYNYAKSHAAFPHESTANQLYTETQFESYRELGSHAVDALCQGLQPGDGLERIVELLRTVQGDPPPCSGDTAAATAPPAGASLAEAVAAFGHLLAGR